VKVVINAIREGRNVEGVHEIVKSLTILQGKCSICTLNERINSPKKNSRPETNNKLMKLTKKIQVSKKNVVRSVSYRN
jgi:hypothetical protein